VSFWNPDRIALLKQVWAKSTHAELVEHFPGATYNAIRKKAHRLGLPHRNVVIGSQGLPVTTLPAEAKAEEFDEAAALKQLQALGYTLNKTRLGPTDRVISLDTGRYDGELVKIGVVSDTHLCSRHQQLTHLKSIYRRFADEGISIVLHAGDLVEGTKVYRGWEHEVLAHGADGQAKYAIEHYPREPGITTYLISGNHDLKFMETAGVDVVARVCHSREDLVYLGEYGAFIDLPGNLRAYLHHGGPGGIGYARTYRLQRTVENFAPENKPHLYICGHYHVTATIPDYRNVFAILPGCFASQSSYLRRLGVAPDVGGWILEYRTNPERKDFDLAEITPRWLPFRKTIPNDY